ncbi:WGR domain-containing protein [Acidocella aquatica]|uniref:WGR domain-containing protein n=1 Tax=Acidocella aquatica TaxID=1922313 RepID=UPI0024E0F47F|nr:WGR domain-containing protein [Acidocella aquatica]
MGNDIQTDISRTKLVLNRIRPEKNERYFCALAITCDLFGETLLWRIWGSIGTSLFRLAVCPNIAAAARSFTKLAHRKHKRGYRST